jgi:predicted Fe-S protein YdhL (DUF1289 family)
MKRITLLTTALALAVSLPTFTATAATGTETAPSSVAEKCEKMATEHAKKHKMTPEQKETYIKSCEQKHMKKAKPHTTAPAPAPAQ